MHLFFFFWSWKRQHRRQLPGYSVVIATAEGAGAPYIALYKYTIAPLSTLRGPRGVSVLSIAIFICIACLHSVVCVQGSMGEV